MYDLLVIGAGPAGITATERAARMGAKVCLVESRRAGGTDAVSGVVPARTLAHIAHLKRTAEQLGRYGIRASNESDNSAMEPLAPVHPDTKHQLQLDIYEAPSVLG